MDEMKLNLTTMFMRGIITKFIRKKLGCDVDLRLNNVHITSKDGEVFLRLDAEASIAHSDLIKIVNKITT